jgi:hypothetical protein
MKQNDSCKGSKQVTEAPHTSLQVTTTESCTGRSKRLKESTEHGINLERLSTVPATFDEWGQSHGINM